MGLFISSRALAALALTSSNSSASWLSSYSNKLSIMFFDYSADTLGRDFCLEFWVVVFLLVVTGNMKLVMLYSLGWNLKKWNYIEFSVLLFPAIFINIIWSFPDFSSMISVPIPFIVNYEIVVSSVFLSLYILLIIQFLKDPLCLIHLLTLIWNVYLVLVSSFASSFSSSSKLSQSIHLLFIHSYLFNLSSTWSLIWLVFHQLSLINIKIIIGGIKSQI